MFVCLFVLLICLRCVLRWWQMSKIFRKRSRKNLCGLTMTSLLLRWLLKLLQQQQQLNKFQNPSGAFDRRGPFTFSCHLVVRCCSAQLPVWPVIERRGHIPAVRTAHELSLSSVLSSSQLFATGWGHWRPNRRQAKLATPSPRRRRPNKGKAPTSSCWRRLPLCEHLKTFNNKMITSLQSD